MIASNTLNRKLRRLEDAHCCRDEIALRKELLEALAEEQRKHELASTCQIQDTRLLSRLIGAGFCRETFPALSLAPIAVIAWASGSVTQQEDQQALLSIFDSDLAGKSRAIERFRNWLIQRPPYDLLDLWTDFVRATLLDLPIDERQQHYERLIRQATTVAMASGGLLGIGKICPAEQEILDAIRDAFIMHHEKLT